MNLLFLIFILLSIFNHCFLSNITEGIYIISFNNKYINLGKNSTIFFTSINNKFSEKKSLFILTKETNESLSNYFYIKEKKSYLYLILSDNYPKISFEYKINDINKNKALWEIIPLRKNNNNLYYYIKNKYYKENLHIEEINYNYDMKIGKELSEMNLFKLIKLYTDNNRQNINSTKLEKEPIDVLIKYIDLCDSKLNRKNIKQLEKDEDNNEIKYSLRSILQNIPWIRKIYILMPNEKISFLKPIEEIKDKIIYIKDHELIGFNSSSVSVFLFNLFKMRKFGLSENFIYMDDDYFIGSPLKKSDFFYEDKGEIYPFLITDSFKEMNKVELEEQQKNLYEKTGKYSQTSNDYLYRKTSTLLFLYKIFGDDNSRGGYPLIEAEFNHNAIPLKLSDIEEIYTLIEKYYEFSDETLKAKYRHRKSLQAQTLFICYGRNKYDRWNKKIWSIFYSLDSIETIYVKHPPSLFVINNSDKKYHYNKYKKEILKLILIFPNKTNYELDNENEKQIIKYIQNGNNNITFLLEFLAIKKKMYNKKNYKYLRYIIIFIFISIIFFYNYRKKQIKKLKYNITFQQSSEFNY